MLIQFKDEKKMRLRISLVLLFCFALSKNVPVKICGVNLHYATEPTFEL